MDLPIESNIKWLVRRYASLLARDGRTEAARKVVLPTGDFFPDQFDGDMGSVNLLFWRLQEHASLTDIDVELRVVDDREEGSAGGGCSTGGCSTTSCGPGGAKQRSLAPVAQLHDGAYRIDLRLSDARTPTALTASLATSLAHLFVLETGGFDGWPEAEWMPTCEAAAVMLGFGVLLANASYQYSKGCHGAHVDQATALPVNEVCLALALFAAVHDHQGARFLSHLDATQRDAFAESKDWVASNAKLIKRIKRDPGAVAADEHLAFEDSRSWLARVFGFGLKKKKPMPDDLLDEDNLAALEASIGSQQFAKSGAGPRPKDAKHLEIAALVDESLAELRSSRGE